MKGNLVVSLRKDVNMLKRMGASTETCGTLVLVEVAVEVSGFCVLCSISDGGVNAGKSCVVYVETFFRMR